MNESEDSASSHLISENIYSHAVMEFQRFAGINESGMIDQSFVSLTNMIVFFSFWNFYFSLKNFSSFLGILDEETIQMMNAPRCGNKDLVGHGEEARRRRKRYALQGKVIIIIIFLISD